MRNKIDSDSQHHESNVDKMLSNKSDLPQVGISNKQNRIFEPPKFLFEVKDMDLLSKHKNNYATLNAFKPKLQPRVRRDIISAVKRPNSKQANQPINVKVYHQFKPKIESKFNKIAETELQKFLNQHKLSLNIRSNEIKDKQRQSIKYLQKDATVNSRRRYDVNYIPRQQNITALSRNKAFYSTKNDFLMQMGNKMKKSVSERLQEMETMFNEYNQKQILEVITIFSIKEQQEAAKLNPKYKRQEPTTTKQIQNYSISPKKYRYKHLQYQEQEQQYIDISNDKIYNKKIHSYLSFLSKVNFSNNIIIKNIQFSNKYAYQKIKVYVGNGNNKYLIIALLKRRFWYEFTNKITKDTKFIWTQNSVKEIHQLQESKRDQKSSRVQLKQQQEVIFDSLMSEALISNQINPEYNDRMYNSVQKYSNSQSNQQNQTCDAESTITKSHIFKLKLKKNIKKAGNTKIFINQLKSAKAEKLLQNFKIIIKHKNQQSSSSNIHPITNHIPHNSFIGSKKALFYTMEHYYRNIKQIDPFTIIPKTYHFKTSSDEDYSQFLKNQKQISQKSIWIVKPGECTNRGNGIYLMKASDISRKLLKKQHHINGQIKTTIVQSYITDPLLYNGRKFDIRHYMMITVVNGCLKAYWYSQGYLRTSSEYFTIDNLSNMFIHLTNDAIQQNSEKYGKYEAGNKLSYNQFQRYLDSNYIKKPIDFKEQIISQMKQIATDVVKANFLNLDKRRKMNNFQIFGLDFMIDSKFRPWLIQINANPCLQISCPLLSRIIPIMVEHSLRLGLDPLILPVTHYPPNKRYYLSDKFIENLRYEIIFDQLEEKTQQVDSSMVYDFQFDQPEDEYENQGADIDLGNLLD